MRRQLLYAVVYLIWTAALIVGVLFLAAWHLNLGGILTILWMIFLASLGMRTGRFGGKETARQIYAFGLPFTVFWMLLPVLAWRLCLRRIKLREAGVQIRLLFRRLTALALTELSVGSSSRSTSLMPFVSTALSWIWPAMLLIGLFLLIGIHIGHGFRGWFWLFLGAALWGFWYYAGRHGFGAALNMVMGIISGIISVIANLIFRDTESSEGRGRRR